MSRDITLRELLPMCEIGPSLTFGQFILSACLGRQSKGWGDGFYLNFALKI